MHDCVCVCVCGEGVKYMGNIRRNIYYGFLACLQPVPRLSANFQPSHGTPGEYHLRERRKWKKMEEYHYPFLS